MKKNNKFFQGHKRLAEERARLWGTQQEAADVFAVSRVTWGQYERGNGTPTGDVLAGLAQHGADVLYILTGQRLPASLLSAVPSAPVPPRVALSADEAELLSDYRASNPVFRRSIKTLLREAASSSSSGLA